MGVALMAFKTCPSKGDGDRMIPNSQEAQRRWEEGLRKSKDSIRAGIQSVTVSPMEQAAAKADQYMEGVRRAVDTGKYQAGLRAVPLETWKQAALTTGLDRLDSGIRKGAPKMGAFLAEFLPYVASVQQQIKAMPNGTEAERDERMLANARQLRQFRRSNMQRRF